ncbi:MAG TPA: glutamate 5-kinase, partial [Rudaea sp.]|nr:glutamate 5-kinase [Rudaea sp.]
MAAIDTKMARTALPEQALPRWHRVVLKVGSNLLASGDGGLTSRYAETLAAFIAASHADEREVVLVSSGAVAAGRALLRQHASGSGGLAARQAL